MACIQDATLKWPEVLTGRHDGHDEICKLRQVRHGATRERSGKLSSSVGGCTGARLVAFESGDISSLAALRLEKVANYRREEPSGDDATNAFWEAVD